MTVKDLIAREPRREDFDTEEEYQAEFEAWCYEVDEATERAVEHKLMAKYGII